MCQKALEAFHFVISNLNRIKPKSVVTFSLQLEMLLPMQLLAFIFASSVFNNGILSLRRVCSLSLDRLLWFSKFYAFCAIGNNFMKFQHENWIIMEQDTCTARAHTKKISKWTRENESEQVFLNEINVIQVRLTWYKRKQREENRKKKRSRFDETAV